MYTALRVVIGWHFLYEGIYKLALENWSSSSYLMGSKWFLSGFFHWIIAHPTALVVTDFLNIWGLIFIGLGLFLGIAVRISSIAGASLLMLYYIANPPFVDSAMVSMSHFFIIDRNLIEAIALILLALIRRDYHWGLGQIIRDYYLKAKKEVFPDADNPMLVDPVAKSRREMIKNLAVLPIFGGALFGMAKKSGWMSFEENDLVERDAVSSATTLRARQYDISELKSKVPHGKIKDVEISRLIPGGNLIVGFAHARDLIYVSDMVKTYNTDEKVIETLWLYEACGINTVILRTDDQVLGILDTYRKRGGKIQWIAQTYPKDDDLTNVQMAIDAGAVGAFVMGNIADGLVYNNRLEYLAKPIDYIRSQGLITGTAGHAIQVPMACAANGIEVDFFMKTFHHDRYWSATPIENRDEYMHDVPYDNLDRDQFRDNIWCADAEEVKAFFKESKVPWIAYKVLAAGAIHPNDGFRYAFENGADFICVGMFDFQVIENANIAVNTLQSNLNRSRNWYG